MDETIHKLIQCRRQSDGHGIMLRHSRILSRLGLRGTLLRIAIAGTGCQTHVDLHFVVRIRKAGRGPSR
jgi:hypothetical protein